MTEMTTHELAPRIELRDEQPDLYRAMLRLDAEVAKAGLEPALMFLVLTRASQINGCAYCIDMHTKDALHAGDTAQRLFALDAWRETPFFTERERAALELTEAMTLIAQGGVPDEVWDRAAGEFTARELAALMFTITAINAWNRLSITSRLVPGDYQP